MSNYTPAQYAESARKHGITQGPWRTSATVSGCGVSVRVVTDYNGGQPIASVGTHDTNLSDRTSAHHENSNEIRENAKRAASLPDLLIALDEKDAEIQRLRKALRCNVALSDQSLSTFESWSEFEDCGFNERPDKSEGFGQFAMRIARAALKGGGA